jgi:hypothetical protein
VVLRVELSTDEPRMLGLFREAFLRWLNDQSSSSFARALGAPGKLAVEEQEGSDMDRLRTLRVDANWADGESSADVPARESVEPPAVFFSDPVQIGAPVYRDRELGMLVSTVALEARALRRPYEQSSPSIAKVRALVRRVQREIAGARSWEIPGITIRTLLREDEQRTIAFGAAATFALVVLAVSGLLYVTTPEYDADVARAEAVSAPPVFSPVLRPATSSSTPTARAARPAAPRAETATPGVGKPAVATTGIVPHVSDARGRSLQTSAAKSKEPAARPDVVRAVLQTAPADPHRTASSIVGTLVVTSEPQGAEVSINGVSQGRTPLKIRGLPAGSRVVRLDLDGYERWSWAVAVVANMQTPVSVKLQPWARRTAPSF